jgi:hypothetical protein
VAANPELLVEEIADMKGVSPMQIGEWRIKSRSIDARQKRIMINLRVEVASKGEKLPVRCKPVTFNELPTEAPVVVIVGAGPAGLFAGLRAVECGIKPIILERGKDVDSRRVDLADISKKHIVDPDSNYCFGEGGAGAYSDGKLYTRSKKRGPVEDILNLLYQHGANESVLIDAHPHIGTDKLPGIIKNIRNTIIEAGGEVHFSTRVESLLIDGDAVLGVKTADGVEYRGPVVLASGHSARDLYKTLYSQGVDLEAKGIAVGVRLEHPQELIDRIQYHNPKGRGPWLPPAEYNFVAQVDGRGVYSFCMCPGGVIVPSPTGPKQSVVNGMSSSARNSKWANSGMVVEVHPEDFPEFADQGPLSILALQESMEANFYAASGNTLNAPAQRMYDFVKGKISVDLPESSYAPGVHPAPVHFLLPEFVSKRLRKGLELFGKRAKGFLTNEAAVVGLESRTSSPVRIPRDKETLCHIRLVNLYPAGEGAGYAGGIVSAAVDGRRCIDAIKLKMDNHDS